MINNIQNPDSAINKSFPAWKQHIRLHPEMYIGAIGDDSMPENGIYRLVKEVLDNALIGIRKSHSSSLIEVSFNDRQVTIRYESIFLHPIDWLVECVSERKHDGIGFDISLVDPIKLYGVGLKVVNLLSSYFIAQVISDGKTIIAEFERGRILEETEEEASKEAQFINSASFIVSFIPDNEIFGDFHFDKEYIKEICLSYMSRDENLKINFTGI